VAIGNNLTTEAAVVTAVAAGRYASAVVAADGTVWGWGLLACGRPEGASSSHRPWAMEGLDGVRVSISRLPAFRFVYRWPIHEPHARRPP
jgi:alpha-tubulin suppressor-like RCC1 family protein